MYEYHIIGIWKVLEEEHRKKNDFKIIRLFFIIIIHTYVHTYVHIKMWYWNLTSKRNSHMDCPSVLLSVKLKMYKIFKSREKKRFKQQLVDDWLTGWLLAFWLYQRLETMKRLLISNNRSYSGANARQGFCLGALTSKAPR